MSLKDFKGAVADFTRVIELEPNNANAYYYRGLSRITLGMKNSGCLDLSKAGELGNKSVYDQIKVHCN